MKFPYLLICIFDNLASWICICTDQSEPSCHTSYFLVEIEYLGGTLLEGGVDKTIVGVVLRLWVHAGSDQVLDCLFHRLHGAANSLDPVMHSSQSAYIKEQTLA